MAYKMKGTTLYGKPTGKSGSSNGDLTVSRTGNDNRPDGKAKSSTFQLVDEKKEMSDEDKKNAIRKGKLANWNEANPNANQEEMNKKQREIWAMEITLPQ